jgi:hypothetical protein
MLRTDESTIWLDNLSWQNSRAAQVIWEAYFDKLV